MDIRRTLEKTIGFPHGWCEVTSSQVALELGLPQTGGHYHSPQSRLTYPHHWNVTPDGRYYVDLTHDQFNPGVPRVAILPINTPVLRELPHVVKYHSRRRGIIT